MSFKIDVKIKMGKRQIEHQLNIGIIEASFEKKLSKLDRIDKQTIEQSISEQGSANDKKLFKEADSVFLYDKGDTQEVVGFSVKGKVHYIKKALADIRGSLSTEDEVSAFLYSLDDNEIPELSREVLDALENTPDLSLKQLLDKKIRIESVGEESDQTVKITPLREIEQKEALIKFNKKKEEQEAIRKAREKTNTKIQKIRGDIEGDLKNNKAKLEKIVEAKKEQLRRKILSSPEYKKLKHTNKKGFTASLEKPKVRKIENLTKKTPNGHFNPSSIMIMRKPSDIFLKETLFQSLSENDFDKGKKDRLIWYEDLGSVEIKPKGRKRKETPSYILKLKNLALQKLQYQIWYGCFIAATYFQILVSNTPVDENYSYNTKSVRKKGTIDRYRTEVVDGRKVRRAATAKEMFDDLSISVETRTKHHKADKESVRGDWILSFRGKNFKAYKTKPSKNGDSFTADVTFNENLFTKKADNASISKIAEKLFMATKSNKDLSFEFNTFNVNPRWEMLEFGGYEHEDSPVKKGKYTHGLTSGYVYQAPRGMIAITNGLYKMLTQSGAMKSTVSNFINSSKNKLDVSDMNNRALKMIFKEFPELKKPNKKVTDIYKNRRSKK